MPTGVYKRNKKWKWSKESRDKVKGKKPKNLKYIHSLPKTKKWKEKMKEGRRKKGWLIGKNHHNWKGGITPENRRIRNSIEFRLWREAVFERDDYTCRICMKRGKGTLHAHHLLSFKNFPKFRLAINNGVTLCKKCHQKIHYEN